MIKKVLVLLSMFFIFGTWVWPFLVKMFPILEREKGWSASSFETAKNHALLEDDKKVHQNGHLIDEEKGVQEDSNNKENGETETPTESSEKAEAKENSHKSDKVVRVNEASVEELLEIYGVGEDLAKNIKKERDDNGPFKHINDLLRVTGIGEKKLKTMESYINLD
ncbi:ComEA family DNA-binding protein [Salipaludibacillus daqingensis]|uniref:ComEA family DNA-binding protein n=1 Tax=Salipaludibacillus daqingensis TaxID=3041001 RepID=UPI002473C88E|nr:helix-hairpin-helix domain-containing protein [Salipaludibacillus daqingensis]